MKNSVVIFCLLAISINVLAQESQPEQNFQKGEELYNKEDYKKAFPILFEIAQEGHTKAQFLIGKMYMLGLGVTVDYTKAMSWYMKAADSDYALAYNNIGVMYMNGWGVDKNPTEGLKWMLKAAEKGLAISQFNIGTYYLLGQGVSIDYQEAFKWLKLAAEQNEVRAFVQLGMMYQDEQSGDKNLKESEKWLTKASNLGDSYAQCLLGELYQFQYGSFSDCEKAAYWYKKSAEQGNELAQYKYGRLYYDGIGVKLDYKIAAEWIRKSAEQNNPDAQNDLGHMYEHGLGVAKSYSKAVDFYRKAAEQGQVYAQCSLGNMYLQGNGVKRNYNDALWWFRKSADKGNPIALANLGYMFENGLGVQKNKSEAINMYIKALEADSNYDYPKNALSRLGVIWQNVIQNKPTAPATTETTSKKSTKEEDGVSIDASGTGFVIDKRGYLATNYHVTEDARGIYVCLQKDGIWKSYNAILVKDDPTNDLAIIKIEDKEFVQFPSLPYNFTTVVEDVAADIYTLGYPRVNVMGTDIKYTAGAINSKTGMQGDPTHYQISAHIDHGNSGGPMFNSKGAIIGITDSGLDKAKYGDVNYAIKTSYLKSLVDALPVKLDLPHDTSIEKLSRVEQIKVLSKFTALILIDLP